MKSLSTKINESLNESFPYKKNSGVENTLAIDINSYDKAVELLKSNDFELTTEKNPYDRYNHVVDYHGKKYMMITLKKNRDVIRAQNFLTKGSVGIGAVDPTWLDNINEKTK